ncbi:MAG: thiol-disulfide oxidoreductase DCC family protein [Cyclobacteriaceae bacterium]
MDSAGEIDPNRPIVLFDGVCNLCNFFVNFIIDHDRKNQFLFGSLQSKEGKRILHKYSHHTDQLKTVVFIDEGVMYMRSTAALRVLKKLGMPWSMFFALIIIPRGFRDRIYDWISTNRYRWFGKRDACRVPTPELQQRFLDS